VTIRNCHDCDVEMEKVTTETKTGWGEFEIIIKGIEAYVCPKCGDKVFDYKTTEMLQNLGKSLSKNSNIDHLDILNVEEVADLLRVSQQTVYNMIRDGRLKASKIGREWRLLKRDVESIINNSDNEIMAAARGEDLSEKDLKVIKEELNKM